jgi:hypothetical protein
MKPPNKSRERLKEDDQTYSASVVFLLTQASSGNMFLPESVVFVAGVSQTPQRAYPLLSAT